MKKLILIFILLLLTLPTVQAESDSPVVRIVTNQGDFTLTLDRSKAPLTVANFLAYVNSGFYEGTIFHRVIKGFMIQGGGLTENMTRKHTLPAVKNEADNGLKNEPGSIAMARTQNPHSATSQFFINTVNNTFLNHRSKSPQGWGYCVFGKVTKGLSTIHTIENTRTTVRSGRRDVPETPVIIRKIVVISD